jgi:hypothetical protein
MIARTIQVALALTLLVASTSPARADDSTPVAPGGAPVEHPSRTRIDAEPGFALPLGDLARTTGPALGGLVGGSYVLDSRWDLVGHLGYLAGTSITAIQVAGVSVGSSLSYAPVLAGARYYLLDPGAVRLYLMAEAGALVVVESETGTGGDSSASSVYLGGAASAGMQLDVLDLRAGVLTADLGHAGTSTSALMTLGFRFASF